LGEEDEELSEGDVVEISKVSYHLHINSSKISG
jgi:hypothetical protein